MSWRQIAYNPAVYLVKVPFTNLITTATNCYVVVDGNDALVIDTGAPTSEGKRVLQEALADIGAYRRNLTSSSRTSISTISALSTRWRPRKPIYTPVGSNATTSTHSKTTRAVSLSRHSSKREGFPDRDRKSVCRERV